MKAHSLVIFSSLLCALAAPRPGRADGSITINPGVNDGPAQLLIQGPTLDGSSTAPGLTIGHSEAPALSGQLEPLSVGIFRLNRPTGLYQWQFSGATDRLAMELKNDHHLVVHSSADADHAHAAGEPDPDQNAIELRPGSGGGVFFNGARLASNGDTSLSMAGGVLEMPPGTNTYGAPPEQYATGLLAAGDSSVAFGLGSVALGRFAQARFEDSVAIGNHAFAEGGGFAFGNNARTFAGTALGSGSYTEWGGTALGPNTHAMGPYSTAIGANAYAGAWTSVGIMGWSTGVNAMAIGAWADAPDAWSAGWGRAEAESSIALGGNTYAPRSLAVHSGVTWGTYSVAIGRGTMAAQDYQVALGLLNLDGRRWTYTASSNILNSVPQAGDPIFVIGNGHPVNDGDPANYSEVRSNAFTVGYDGAAWVQGAITVEGGPVDAPVTSVFKHDVSVQGVLRVPESGDLSMGAFTAGPQP